MVDITCLDKNGSVVPKNDPATVKIIIIEKINDGQMTTTYGDTNLEVVGVATGELFDGAQSGEQT